MKFVLLHEGKNDDGIKSFFMDVWELYVKVSLFEFKINWMRERERDNWTTPFFRSFVDDVESFSYCS